MLVLLLSICVTLFDQITKCLVLKYFSLGESKTIISGLFDLSYVQNTGAAWGILQGQNILLISLSIVVLIVISVFHKSFITDSLIHRISGGLIVGGIVGNLIDRVRLGYVVDFMDFYWRSYSCHFPAFNIADSAICVGVGLYMITQFKAGQKELSDDGEQKNS